MTRKERLTSAALSAVMLVGMAGFVASPVANAAAASKLKIEFIPGDATDPYYLTMIRGADLEAKKLNVSLSWTASPTWNESNETAILRTVIAKKPNGIAITPNSPTGMIAPILAAVKAHIQVALVDSPLSGKQPVVSTVIMHDHKGGWEAARLMAQLIHKQGQVYIADASAGDATEIPRLQGFVSYIQHHYPKIHVVGVEYNNDNTSTAATQLQDILLRYPHLAGVFATNSYSGMGVGEELKTLGKAGKIKVIAYDADPPEVQYLKSGLFQGLVVQNPYRLGQLVVKNLVLHLRGKKVPALVQLNPVLATRQNMTKPAIANLFYHK